MILNTYENDAEKQYKVCMRWRAEIVVQAKSEDTARSKALSEFPKMSNFSDLPELESCEVIENGKPQFGVYLVEGKSNCVPAFVTRHKKEAENLLALCGYEDDFNIIFVPMW